MASVAIDAGVCGHTTRVTTARGDAYRVHVSVDSTCPHIQKIKDEIGDVDALQQIGLRDGIPSVLRTAYAHCAHAACPVPAGLIKAIEVAAGLALPQDVSMRIDKEG
jgi:hypothetical protein